MGLLFAASLQHALLLTAIMCHLMHHAMATAYCDCSGYEEVNATRTQGALQVDQTSQICEYTQWENICLSICWSTKPAGVPVYGEITLNTFQTLGISSYFGESCQG